MYQMKMTNLVVSNFRFLIVGIFTIEMSKAEYYSTKVRAIILNGAFYAF